MSARVYTLNSPCLVAITLAAIGLLGRSAMGDDRLAKPERIETTQDARRLTEDVKVEVSVDKYRFDQLEPVRLYAEAENVSGSALSYPSSGYPPHVNYRNFRVKVFNSKGDLMPETRFQKYDVKYLTSFPVGGRSFGAEFSPGSVIWHELVANLVYDMSSPGTYTILVEFPTGRTRTIDDEEVPIVAQSRLIQVEVIDPPPRITPRRDLPEANSH